MNILFLILRLVVGLLFIVSGGEKLIGPYQNFLFVVQSYEFLPPVLEEITARVVPWIELIAGLFCLLGLWTLISLRTILLMFTVFILIVTQAIVRDLPISECGCFGELASFPLHGVLLFDSVMFFITFFLIKYFRSTVHYSLDSFFDKRD